MTCNLQKIVVEQSKISNYQPPPQFLGPLCVDRNKKLASAIMKEWKNGPHFTKKIVDQSFQLPTPKSLGLRFAKYHRKWKTCISHYEKVIPIGRLRILKDIENTTQYTLIKVKETN